MKKYSFWADFEGSVATLCSYKQITNMAASIISLFNLSKMR